MMGGDVTLKKLHIAHGRNAIGILFNDPRPLDYRALVACVYVTGMREEGEEVQQWGVEPRR
jgi:hypothetical protein